MKPNLEGLSPEQKRALLARLLKQQPAVGKTAYILQGLLLDWLMHPCLIGNMRSTIRFFRKIDPELLRRRMQRVIDRHPALRTTYHVNEEREVDFFAQMLAIRLDAMKMYQLNAQALIEQRVHPTHELEFKVTDASGWTPEQLRDHLLEDANQDYDLHQLPVCRLRLYRRKHDDIMQLDVHHCAVDLWSMETIVAELEQPPEGDPPPSFAEFCAWQHAWCALPQAEEMRQWWKANLEGCPDLALPHSIGEDAADFVPFRVEGELMALARQACRTHKITLFNLILSTLQVTLRDWMGQHDLAVGGAVANRTHPRFEHTVGFFAQLVLYRQNMAEVRSWEDLWARNRSTINGVLDRQFFPLTTTVWTPRADVWIMFQQYQKARWYEGDLPQTEPLELRSAGVVDSPLGPWELVYVEPPYLTAPVMFEIIEQKDGLLGFFRYRITAFTKKKGRAFVARFQDHLRTSLENPGAPLPPALEPAAQS